MSDARPWQAFYEAVRHDPPRPTLVRALDAFDQEFAATPRLAVDLGCGAGNDTAELLRRGWRVVAVDREPQALEFVRERMAGEDASRLRTECASFESFSFPRAHLVNASFSLPFCPAPAFPGVWRRIVEALEPNGRFSGQFFGDRDEWAGRSNGTFHRRSDVEELLSGFEVEWFDEQDFDGRLAVGTPKHWHLFHVVARKR